MKDRESGGRWDEVSVLVPAHDSADTVERALESVAAQTVSPAATILIDDGSSDETGAIAGRLGVRVLPLTTPNGAAGARNAGLRAATTPLCALLDADDAWHPNHLESLRDAAEAHPDAALWLFGSVRQTAEGRFAGTAPAAPRAQRVTVLDLLVQEVVPTTSAALLHREAALEIGGFDEDRDYRPASCEDLDLWLRIAAARDVWAFPAATVSYYVSDGHRDRGRLAANERARLHTVERALASCDLDGRNTKHVWAVTWCDLGLWRLKHEPDGRAARRRFLRAWAARPLDLKFAALALLALVPARLTRFLRRGVRSWRRSMRRYARAY